MKIHRECSSAGDLKTLKLTPPSVYTWKNVYSALVGWNVLLISVWSKWLIVLFRSSVFILIFVCLFCQFLRIDKMLKCPTLIMDFSLLLVLSSWTVLLSRYIFMICFLCALNSLSLYSFLHYPWYNNPFLSSILSDIMTTIPAFF